MASIFHNLQIKTPANTARKLAIVATFATSTSIAVAQTIPNWWQPSPTGFGLIDGSPPLYDVASTQGQAKHAAHTAYQYLNDALAPIGGAGPELDTLIQASWFQDLTTNNLALQNGQLKYLAAPFYNRLLAIGFDQWPICMSIEAATGYPWTQDTSDDNDSALTTLGQVKFLFSWDLTGFDLSNVDADQDLLLDHWEVLVGLDPMSSDQNGNGIQDDIDDFDGDGVTNSNEYNNGLNSTSIFKQDNPLLELVVFSTNSK